MNRGMNERKGRERLDVVTGSSFSLNELPQFPTLPLWCLRIPSDIHRCLKGLRLVQTWQDTNTEMKLNTPAFVRGCVLVTDNEDGATEGHRVIRPQCKSEPD